MMPIASRAGDPRSTSSSSPTSAPARKRPAPSVAIWRNVTRPYWMTREPPLNCVGVTLASSAPWAVSKTSLLTLIASWTKQAPMIVRIAARRSKAPWLAAITMPSTTGTIVALRKGRRVVRRTRNGSDRRGFTGVPRSRDSASK